MFDSFLDSAEFISIWLGFSGFILAVATVMHYWPKAKMFLKSPTARDFSGWLSLGIFLGMLGSTLDTSYWQAAWASDFMSWPAKTFLFKHGVLANIPFRNMVLIASAYCHYRAILLVRPDKRAREADLVTIGSLLIGFILALIMLGLRGA